MLYSRLSQFNHSGRIDLTSNNFPALHSLHIELRRVKNQVFFPNSLISTCKLPLSLELLAITSPWHNAEDFPTIEDLLLTPRIKFL